MKKIFWQICFEGTAWKFGVDPEGPHLQRTPNGVAALWCPIFEDGLEGWIGFKDAKQRDISLFGKDA